MNEIRQLAQLTGWDKNPRTITKEAFERLKYQIQHLNNGKPYKPLLINQDNIVLGGNMRLEAYKELGIDPVEVSVVQTSNESEMWEYALSDNDHVGLTDIDMIINAMPQLDIDWSQYAVEVKPAQDIQDLITKLTTKKPIKEIEGIACPNCGHRFKPEKGKQNG